jgi:large subunit ribosomal protein L31
MKKDIHPQYFGDAQITCNCGNVIHAGSTIEAQKVEICSACHPFYTGKQKLMDTAGRVNKFLERQKKAQEKQAAKEKGKKKEEEPVAEEAKAEQKEEA